MTFQCPTTRERRRRKGRNIVAFHLKKKLSLLFNNGDCNSHKWGFNFQFLNFWWPWVRVCSLLRCCNRGLTLTHRKYPSRLVSPVTFELKKKKTELSISDRMSILRSFYDHEVEMGWGRGNSIYLRNIFNVQTSVPVLGKFPVVLQCQEFAYKGFKPLQWGSLIVL